ncbi:hypothetical protein V2G26_015539 [Clonostachys chloroleuca]
MASSGPDDTLEKNYSPPTESTALMPPYSQSTDESSMLSVHFTASSSRRILPQDPREGDTEEKGQTERIN